MLERLGAFDRPSRFRDLLLLWLCDYNAYERLADRPYEKAAILEAALAACSEIGRQDLTEAIGDAAVPDWLSSARAGAIAEAFRSLRWSGDEPPPSERSASCPSIIADNRRRLTSEVPRADGMNVALNDAGTISTFPCGAGRGSPVSPGARRSFHEATLP